MAALGTTDDVHRWFVPGRIEVLGKHTDYAGGRSLLCAVERGMCVVAAARTDDQVRITDAATSETIQLALSPDLKVPAAGWPIYPATVVRRVSRNFAGSLRGANIAFASDLPPSAGLSSSSVLIVGTFVVLSDFNRLHERPEYVADLSTREDLAGYLGAVENGSAYGSLAGDRGVGTFGGSEDHTAILCARPGSLVQYRFCPVKHERTIPLPYGHCFVVASSGVVAEKTGAARERYNRTSRAATAILECWRAATGRRDVSLFATLTSSSDAPQRMRQILTRSTRSDFAADVLLSRCEQFMEESLVVIPACADALARGDLREFGALVDRSQRAAEALLGNQVPETIELARSARSLGAHAASTFGAGFGGSVWALVDNSQRDDFLKQWHHRYRQTFPEVARRSTFFASAAGPSLLSLNAGCAL